MESWLRRYVGDNSFGHLSLQPGDTTGVCTCVMACRVARGSGEKFTTKKKHENVFSSPPYALPQKLRIPCHIRSKISDQFFS